MRYSANEPITDQNNGSGHPLKGTRPPLFDQRFNLISLDQAIEYVIELNEKYPDINYMGLSI